MQKHEFKYRRHELDDLQVRTIYEATYEEAIEDFIEWIYSNGFIGYFDEKTVIGNPANRNHVTYTDDLTHSSMNVYVLQYIMTDYHADPYQGTEQKKVCLYMSDAIDEFIAAIRDLQNRENIKNIVAYKGNLVEFDYRQLDL